jgi:hypothetical protein
MTVVHLTTSMFRKLTPATSALLQLAVGAALRAGRSVIGLM